MRPGPVARHALWLIVLIKFLTPPVVEWPWALPDPMGLASQDLEGLAVQDTRASESAAAEAFASDVLLPEADLAADGREADAASIASSAIPDWWVVFGLVWMAGSLWMLGIESLRYRRVSRLLRTAELPDQAPDQAIDARVRDLASHLGVAPPTVRVVDGMRAPFLWPVGAVKLVLPRQWPDDTTPASIDALIVHELAHLKRRDHYVAWMQLAAGVLWWWNPLFWYVRATVREQAELACDAWVISTLPDGRRAYAESLITLSGPALQGRSAARGSSAGPGT